MSDESMPPPLSDEASAFLERHVVEPDAAALERVRSRVVPRKRSRMPPELLAVAAVLVLIGASQVVWLVLRREPPSSSKAVIEAYRSGDIALAQQMASRCTGSGCDQVTVEGLARLEILTRRRTALTADERRELQRLEAVWWPPEWTEAEMVKQVRFHQQAGQLDNALGVAEQCIARDSTALACLRTLASVRAQVGARDQSISMMEKSKRAYETYLELAPANDPYRGKISAILDSTKEERGGIGLTVPVGEHGEVSLGERIGNVTGADARVATAMVIDGVKVDVRGVSAGVTTLTLTLESGEVHTVTVTVGP